MNELDRLSDAFAPAPAQFKGRISYTLDNMEVLTVKRKHKISLVVVTAILILLAGIALAAAAQFGVMDFFTMDDGQGNVTVNEAIRPMVQPVGEEREGNAAKVMVREAMCNGSTLSLAWTVENKLADAPVYVVWRAVVEGGDTTFGGGTASAFSFFLDGQAVRDGGLAFELVPAAVDETLQVDVQFSILTTDRELTYYEPMEGDATEADVEAQRAQIAEDLANGKLPVVCEEIDTSGLLLQEGETLDEALVRLGYMQRVDMMEIPLTLAVSAEMVNLMPGVAEPVIALEGYKVSLVDVKGSATSMQYAVEYTFAAEDKAKAFQRDRYGLAIWAMVPEGEDRWYGGAGTDDGSISQREDGRWALRYEGNMSGIIALPDEVVLTAHGVISQEVYPGEAFAIDLTGMDIR